MTSRLLLPAILALVACSSAVNDKNKVLPIALEEFNAALVWKNFGVAAEFLPPEAVHEGIARLRKRSGKLNIVDVEPLETRVALDGNSAAALIRFSWYEERDLTVRKGVERQRWERHKGSWRMVSQEAVDDPSQEPSPFVDRPQEQGPPEPAEPQL
jgi:hypothetical protein